MIHRILVKQRSFLWRMGEGTVHTEPTLAPRNLTPLRYSELLCRWAMDPVTFNAFNNVQ